MAVFVAELRSEQALFPVELDEEGEGDDFEADEGVDGAGDDRAAEHRGEPAGVDGVADESIWAGGDDFVAFFEGDDAAPVTAEMKSCPDGEGDAGDDEEQAGVDDPVVPAGFVYLAVDEEVAVAIEGKVEGGEEREGVELSCEDAFGGFGFVREKSGDEPEGGQCQPCPEGDQQRRWCLHEVRVSEMCGRAMRSD